MRRNVISKRSATNSDFGIPSVCNVSFFETVSSLILVTPAQVVFENLYVNGLFDISSVKLLSLNDMEKKCSY